MTREQAEFLVNAMQDEGVEAELHEGYSGRGMYGRETFAVIADGLGNILGPAIRAARDDPDAMPDFDDFCPSVDSMGRGIVIY